MHDLTVSSSLKSIVLNRLRFHTIQLYSQYCRGWLSAAKIFDDMRTLCDPFILIWENNCISSLMSVVGRVHISLCRAVYRCTIGAANPAASKEGN